MNAVQYDRTLLLNSLYISSYQVYDLQPPMKEFHLSIVVQEMDYTRIDGTEVWVNKATLDVGPHRTVVKSDTLTVRMCACTYHFPCVAG